MSFIINNTNYSLRVTLTWLRVMGLWAPSDFLGWKKVLYNCYTVFVYMFVVGIFIFIQVADLYIVWGDIQLMTAAAFVLFTNLTHSTKILNIVLRASRIKRIVRSNDRVLRLQETIGGKNIVKSCDHEVNIYCIIYAMVTLITIVSWWLAAALEGRDKQLPMRAWYPFNTSNSPMYELTYTHQCLSLFLSASMNASKDVVVTTLIAQCRCRFRLISVALKGLCHDLNINANRLTKDQEDIVEARLRNCVREHQDTLATVNELQNCFSEPTFAQFTVSLVIICVTAFQLVQPGRPVRMLSMTFYLLNMLGQVYIYCREGNELSIESGNVSRCVYAFPWYSCGVRVRRTALLVMTRCGRSVQLTAAGLTTLSLASFMSICKASYSFFTVLKQVDEES